MPSPTFPPNAPIPQVPPARSEPPFPPIPTPPLVIYYVAAEQQVAAQPWQAHAAHAVEHDAAGPWQAWSRPWAFAKQYEQPWQWHLYRCQYCKAELRNKQSDWCYSCNKYGRPRVKVKWDENGKEIPTRLRGPRAGQKAAPKYYAAMLLAKERGQLAEFLDLNERPKNRYEDANFQERTP